MRPGYPLGRAGYGFTGDKKVKWHHVAMGRLQGPGLSLGVEGSGLKRPRRGAEENGLRAEGRVQDSRQILLEVEFKQQLNSPWGDGLGQWVSEFIDKPVAVSSLTFRSSLHFTRCFLADLS